MPRALKIIVWLAGIALALVMAAYVAFRVSPWPAALLIRHEFEAGAAKVSQALAKHLTANVSARLNVRYDEADPDARLDVFYPAQLDNTDRALPTVVWVHGGGWVSGSKDEIANYARVLAGKGFTVVGVDYSIAPGKTYPTPVRQVNTALGYLVTHAQRLHVDPTRLFLAGDSGGAHIAAQAANLTSVPAYAAELGIAPAVERSRLRGVVLFCGPYDTKSVNLEGPFGGFMRTVLWSYSGGRDFATNPRFATASVINYVTPEFPPAFISAGNADPLLPQSRAFAAALALHGVTVDLLFFPDNYSPALPHEYQFNLDTEAGQMALERTVGFLNSR